MLGCPRCPTQQMPKIKVALSSYCRRRAKNLPAYLAVWAYHERKCLHFDIIKQYSSSTFRPGSFVSLVFIAAKWALLASVCGQGYEVSGLMSLVSLFFAPDPTFLHRRIYGIEIILSSIFSSPCNHTTWLVVWPAQGAGYWGCAMRDLPLFASLQPHQ